METKILKVSGSDKFVIDATEFFISPLSTDSHLYIDKLSNGDTSISEDSKQVADIKGGEYTKVHGALPNIRYHIDTSDNFIIMYSA